MDYREPADEYGLHRVLEPAGALPQAARRLDASAPPFVNEVAIEVERLNIDSASFHQIVEDVGEDPGAIGDRIFEIVAARGKMQNPATGSGGMLLGTVGAVGPDYAGPAEVLVGDRVATLVSLTLTPLELSQVRDVDLEADQVVVDGRAYLWSSAPLVVMPDDLDEPVALSIFDVCGAPAQTRRLANGAKSVLVLGAGKSGMMSAATARDVVGKRGAVYAVDVDDTNLELLAESGILSGYAVADATAPVEVLREVESMHSPGEVDVVINTCNVPGTELSAILPCRNGGSILFFNMATSFTRATLGAEGVGKDVDLLMGNGYADGHAEYAMKIVRKFPVVRERLEDLVGES